MMKPKPRPKSVCSKAHTLSTPPSSPSHLLSSWPKQITTVSSALPMNSLLQNGPWLWGGWEKGRSSTRRQTWRTDSRDCLLPIHKARARAGVLPGCPRLAYQPASILTGEYKSHLECDTFLKYHTYDFLNVYLKFEDSYFWFLRGIMSNLNAALRLKKAIWVTLIAGRKYWEKQKSVLSAKLITYILKPLTLLGNKHKVLCKILNTYYNWLVLWTKRMTRKT